MTQSKPMKNLQKTIGIISCAVMLTGALAQDIPADRVSVPLRDPSRPGLVKVNLMTGGIVVKGYDGKEIVIEARLREPIAPKKENKKSEGLKPIEIART